MGGARTRKRWEYQLIRLGRWLTPGLDRNIAAEGRFVWHGLSPGAVICHGRIQLTIERGARVTAGLKVNRIGLCINEGLTPNDATTVMTVRKGGELHLGGAAIGRGCRVLVGAGAKLSVGAGTYFNDGARIHAAREVRVGDGCAIAWNVTLLDDDEHGFGPPPYSAPLVIEDGVWIGCNVTVLKGVTVGRGSVVAAGSVVTRSCPAHSLIGGSPARLIRSDVHWTDAQHWQGPPA